MQRSLPFFGDTTSGAVIRPERLPTNTTTHKHPVHRWFNFIAGFSPEFVSEVLEEPNADRGDVLLDPFAGCGTAPLVGLKKKLSVVGFEPHPIFYRISRAKLIPPLGWSHVERIHNAIRNGLARPCSVAVLAPAQAAFLGKLFPHRSLEALLGAREYLRVQDLLKDDLAFLILSKVVEKSSHSQTDGIYKAPTSRREPMDPVFACESIIRMIKTDLTTCADRSPQAKVALHQCSSESMPQVQTGSVSVIITSPPYLNNFDYAEMTRMLLYFWDIADSWGAITDLVRSKLLVNTTTALKGHKTPKAQETYRSRIPIAICSQLEPLVEMLRQQRAARAGKKEYDLLVLPYFAQMLAVLEECKRVLKPRATIHIMIADAALYGVHIPTPQLLRDMLEQIGFEQAECSLVRARGHRWALEKRTGSDTGLGEYCIRARRGCHT